MFKFFYPISFQRDNGFDEDFSAFEEDESFARFGNSLVTSSSVLPIVYQLDCPIKLTKLESMSHQLISVYDKEIGGKPTAISISSNLIAVGTNRGLTVLFDRKTERLLQFMHDDKGNQVLLHFQLLSRKVSGLCLKFLSKRFEDSSCIQQRGHSCIQNVQRKSH